MPTVRPTKRLLLPSNKEEAAVFNQIIEDQATLSGLSTSDVIIRDVMAANLPQNEFVLPYAVQLYAGYRNVLTSASDIFAWNAAGVNWQVRETTYRELLDFVSSICARKHAWLDPKHERMFHLRSKLNSIVKYIEHINESRDEELDVLAELHEAENLQCGLRLLADLEKNSDGVYATELMLFINDAFERVKNLQSTSAALLDICLIAGESDTYPPDTAQQRRDWLTLLDKVTSRWGVVDGAVEK